MGAIKSAIGDAVITFLWVFSVSTIGAFTTIISSALHLQGFASSLLVITVFIAFLVFVFNLIAQALGGASFNPTGTVAFYAAGFGGDSLFSLALRFPAQAAGAVGGALAILEIMPVHHKHLLGGPRVKVDLHTAAVAEGVLTFLISFSVLWIVIKGPKSPFIKCFMIAIATVTMVVSGSGYTGPAMNPANASGTLCACLYFLMVQPHNCTKERYSWQIRIGFIRSFCHASNSGYHTIWTTCVAQKRFLI